MGDVPIIGQTKPEPQAPSLDELTDEQRAALEALAEEEEDDQEQVSVATAFMLVLHHDGHWEISLDSTQGVLPSRPPSDDDITAGAAVATQMVQVAKTANTTAMAVMQAMQMQMQHVMAAQRDAQILQKVGPSLRG